MFRSLLITLGFCLFSINAFANIEDIFGRWTAGCFQKNSYSNFFIKYDVTFHKNAALEIVETVYDNAQCTGYVLQENPASGSFYVTPSQLILDFTMNGHVYRWSGEYTILTQTLSVRVDQVVMDNVDQLAPQHFIDFIRMP